MRILPSERSPAARTRSSRGYRAAARGDDARRAAARRRASGQRGARRRCTRFARSRSRQTPPIVPISSALVARLGAPAAGRRQRVRLRSWPRSARCAPRARSSRSRTGRRLDCRRGCIADANAAGRHRRRRPGSRQHRRDRARGGSGRRDRRRGRRRVRRPVRLEGAARIDGQRAAAADRRAGVTPRSRSTSAPPRLPDRRDRAARRPIAVRGRLHRPVAILIGGEGAGLAAALVAHADERVTIPMQAPVESLNAAVTRRRVIVYEARRQTNGVGEPLNACHCREPMDSLFPGRTARRKTGAGAARRADAAADLRRVRRPGGAARAGQAAARGDRARPAAVDHPLGPAGHRQDDAGANHRRHDEGAVRVVQRRARRASRKSAT